MTQSTASLFKKMSKFFLYPISRVAHLALASLLTVFRRLGRKRQPTGASLRTARYRATAVNQPNRQHLRNGSPYPPKSRRSGIRPYPGLIGLGLAVMLFSQPCRCSFSNHNSAATLDKQLQNCRCFGAVCLTQRCQLVWN